jgi:hypothetical protein
LKKNKTENHFSPYPRSRMLAILSPHEEQEEEEEEEEQQSKT